MTPAPAGSARPAEHLQAGDVSLRRFRIEDAPALHAAVLDSLEELRPWMPWAAAEPLALAQRRDLITGAFDEGWSTGSDFVYGLFLGEQALGGCGLHRRIGDDGLEIGYWIRTGHTGRGLATAAARALSEEAFRLDGVVRVEIHHDKANVASGRVPAKLGFVLVREVEDAATAPGEVGISCEWRLERRPSH